MKSLRVKIVLMFGFAILLAAALQFTTSVNATIHEANKLFDYHMQQMALALQDSDFKQLDSRTVLGIESNNFDLVVQIWGADGERVYQSRQYRSLPKQAELGYSTVTLTNGEWRIYAVKAHDRVIQVAQKMNTRSRRAIAIALSTLWPVIPVSLLLFCAAWWSISSALSPLNRIGKQLAERKANSTDTVSDEGVPQEVSALVFELNSLLLRIAHAMQSQQRFVADAAHELRSPITALRLQVQNLSRARDETMHEKAIDRLLGGVDRASHLVEQLLMMARQDHNYRGAIVMQKVSIISVLNLAFNDVHIFAQRKNISLIQNGVTGCFVFGDPENLRVMIRNLLDNAIRYIPDWGTVEIFCGQQDNEILLSIDDSGDGIPESERNRIFDRFYRIPGTSKNGSGLGLAIVKAIVDMHNASIKLTSSKLGGLKVEVIFPSAPGNE
ncbi:ATP-binding protein [Undibacterium sp. MH2W]|uniref:ATP-binding protein n=1 Tax=Undibacterium sp. MH2W TaxID=3413044 RepID=UPI003BF444FF